MDEQVGDPRMSARAMLNPFHWRRHLLTLSPAGRIIFLTRLFDMALRVGTTLIGMWVGLLGVAILAGGENRFDGPQFETTLTLAPWWAWPVVPIAAGHVLMFGIVHRPLIVPAALICAIWAGIFTYTLADAASNNPGGTVTGIVTYGVLTALLLGVAILHGLIRLVARGTSDQWAA